MTNDAWNARDCSEPVKLPEATSAHHADAANDTTDDTPGGMTKEQIAANFMAAAAHLLVGKAGRNEALNTHVAIMFGGRAIPLFNLMHWGDWVRRSGRQILHFSFDHVETVVPTLSMVCVIEGQTRIFEHCLLWQRAPGGQVYIIPDNFEFGAYVIGRDLRLRHLKRSPIRDLETATDGLVLACRRLGDIARAQIKAGTQFKLPTLLETRAM